MATMTPSMAIALSNNTEFQNRLEMQVYNQCKWYKQNWSTPANLAQQKCLTFANGVLQNGFNIQLETAVKRALAGTMGEEVDDPYSDADLEVRVIVLCEDMAGVLPGDDQLPVA